MSEANPDTAVRSKPILERHLQTVLLALVVALLGWSGNTTLTLIETSARQDERISTLISLTENLRQDLRDVGTNYMKVNDAAIYRSQINGRIDALDGRLKRLEDR
ncbi:hypothetical protein ACUN9Y_09605 [Halomonas sp. V046]|uniref:hypothetical protein n=1 Tax=Halomonas sp. V046 TaxID=3459611 RepID=UPI0040439F4D